jgi:hypothetical protein
LEVNEVIRAPSLSNSLKVSQVELSLLPEQGFQERQDFLS